MLKFASAQAFFTHIKIMSFAWPTMLHIKKLMGMHNKETYTHVHVCVCIDICSFTKYACIIHVGIVRRYLSCTVINWDWQHYRRILFVVCMYYAALCGLMRPMAQWGKMCDLKLSVHSVCSERLTQVNK